jgi:hypothetical protein
MKKQSLFIGGAVLGLFLLAPQAGVAQLTLDGPDCNAFNNFVASTGSVSYISCGGAFAGNDSNQNVVGWVFDTWGMDVAELGKTDGSAEELGPFVGFGEGSTSGNLLFNTPVSGVFVLSLKAASRFSLYLFDTGAESWTSLTYGTEGTSAGNDLSHATFYAGSTVVVPEPASAFLLLLGIMGVGFVARRRRDDQA